MSKNNKDMSVLSTHSSIEAKCAEKGLKMTGQRRVIAQVVSASQDHPDVEMLYQRSVAIDPNISIARGYE